jgi:uncharacterized protein (TIGR00725 family)
VKTLIAVIGGRKESHELLVHAEETGKEIAKRGAVLICGGLTGTMEAAARGAKAEGGITVGILPGNSPTDANQYIDIPLATGLGLARNAIIMSVAHAVVAIGGSYGTLSEIAYALQYNKPIVGINTWNIEGVTTVKNAHEAIHKLFAEISPQG